MPKPLVGSIRSAVEEGGLHYRAKCWQIIPTRVAVAPFRFTDHQEPITFADGQVFLSTGGMDSSAQERRAMLETVNANVRGIISDESITDEEMERGIFIDASVYEYIVDWRTPFLGVLDFNVFIARGVSYDGAIWNMELESTAEKLAEPTGDIWGPMCRVELFSQGLGKCNIPAAGFLESNTIAATDGQTEFTTNAIVNPDWVTPSYGQDGRVTFYGGLNNGFSTRIKTYTYSGGPNTAVVTLQERTPYPMLVTEGVVMHPGCNKRATGHCQFRYDNVVNFQGEPYIPGGDRARKGVPIR